MFIFRYGKEAAEHDTDAGDAGEGNEDGNAAGVDAGRRDVTIAYCAEGDDYKIKCIE